jgi:predicted metal-binding membrane protein
MRRDNAELEHEAADRPSGASPTPTHDAARPGSVRMTALIRIDTQPGRERPLVIACLAVLVAVCWACLVFRALGIATLDPAALANGLLVAGPLPGGAPGSAPAPYRAPELVLVLAMWGAMLSAITLPAVTPAILLFAHINRLAQALRFPNVGTLFFVAGYLAVWSGFGALATLAQWALHDAGALDTSMAIVNPSACGLALVAAGVYQWTPAKHACLQHCRAPLSFVVTGWCPGLVGALRMGCTHGMNCVGCCWLLMLLLFAAGVTNLGALLALAGLVLSEKLLPGGPVVACISGLALVAWGTLLLFP